MKTSFFSIGGYIAAAGFLLASSGCSYVTQKDFYEYKNANSQEIAALKSKFKESETVSALKIAALEKKLEEKDELLKYCVDLRIVFPSGDSYRVSRQMADKYMELFLPEEGAEPGEIRKFITLAGQMSGQMSENGIKMLAVHLNRFADKYFDDMLPFAGYSPFNTVVKQAASALPKAELKKYIEAHRNTNGRSVLLEVYASQADASDFEFLLENSRNACCIQALNRLNMIGKALPVLKEKLYVQDEPNELLLTLVLKNMPESEFNDFCDIMYQKIQRTYNDWQRLRLLNLLAGAGHVKSFLFMADQFKSFLSVNDQFNSMRSGSGMNVELDRNLFRLTGIAHSEKRQEWIEQNRNNLVFDRNSRTYKAGKAGEENEKEMKKTDPEEEK